jgi:hypothetical protein
MDELFPAHLAEFLEERESEGISESLVHGARFQDERGIRERDEGQAAEAALEDLLRLGRYERRAWSRQRRALLEFINLTLTKRLQEQKWSARKCFARSTTDRQEPEALIHRLGLAIRIFEVC